MVIVDGILTQLPAGYRFDPTDEELMKFYLTNKVFDRPVPGEVVKDIDANELYSNSPNAIVNFTAAEDEKREWYFFIHHRKHYKKEQEKEKIEMAENGLDFWTSPGDLKKEQEEKEKHQMGGNGFGFWSFQEEQEIGKIRMTGNGKTGEELFQEEQEKEKVRKVGNGIGFWRSIGKEDPIYDTSGKVFAFKIHFIYFKGCGDGGKKTHWRMEEYHLTTTGRRGDEKEDWVLGRITRGTGYSCCY